MIGTTAAFAFAGCGFPAIGYTEDDNGGPSSSSSTGAAGQGGSSSSSSSGVGGQGGEGGCTFGAIGSCDAGQKCSLLDENAGPAGGVECTTAGLRPMHAFCEDSSQCQDGLFCNRFNDVCQPICNNGNECVMGQQCIAVKGPGNTIVPGVTVCTANCHPSSTSPCSQSYGAVTCAIGTVGWECAASEGIMLGDTCSSATSCAAGMGCVGNICRALCAEPAIAPGNPNTCNGGTACFKFTEAVYHNNIEFGYCN